MTNYERIVNMSKEELADWLDSISNEDRSDWDPIGCSGCIDKDTHHYPECCEGCKWETGIKGWLEKEV